MNLAAAILLFGIYSTGLSSQDSPVQAQSPANSAQSSSSGQQSNPEQVQSPTPQAPAPSKSVSSAKQEPVPSAKSSSAKKRVHKKKASIAPCDASNSAGQASNSNASNAASVDPPSGPSTTPTAKDCPPPKIVVPQGGTGEPSIQLAGGDQASQKRAAATQMLGATEANLKKIAGLQLSEAQKDTVVQIRQFVNQSKEALAAGDAERGKTLAWKAQLLSEDLVQPEK